MVGSRQLIPVACAWRRHQHPQPHRGRSSSSNSATGEKAHSNRNSSNSNRSSRSSSNNNNSRHSRQQWRRQSGSSRGSSRRRSRTPSLGSTGRSGRRRRRRSSMSCQFPRAMSEQRALATKSCCRYVSQNACLLLSSKIGCHLKGKDMEQDGLWQCSTLVHAVSSEQVPPQMTAFLQIAYVCLLRCSGPCSYLSCLPGVKAFNWESANAGDWWGQVERAAGEISTAGFSVAWLPPPTQSVSRQGYMPTDLYDLNSAYGSADSLKR